MTTYEVALARLALCIGEHSNMASRFIEEANISNYERDYWLEKALIKPKLKETPVTAREKALLAYQYSNWSISACVKYFNTNFHAVRNDIKKANFQTLPEKPSRQYITPEQIDQIFILRAEQGRSFPYIAKELGVPVGNVKTICLFKCIEHPSVKKRFQRRNPPVYYRNGKAVRSYTPEEDEAIFMLEAKGLSYGEIAKETGRAKSSIRTRIAHLARLEERKHELECMESPEI